MADLIAPGAVEVARDHVRIDRHYLRTLAVTAYPRTVAPGWLAPLLYAPDPLELSLHVQPLASGEMVKALSHKLVQLHSSRLLDARGGRLADPEREVAYDDVERLRDALQRGEERVFATSLYLLLRAPTPEGLDELTRRTEAILDGMLAQSRVALLEQEGGLRACLPLGDDRLLAYRNLDTSSLATTFPFSAHALAMERGVFYGVARHGQAPVIVDPFDASLENANTAVIATSGAGKSYSTKLLALRHHLLGVDVLVVDPEDEYRRLCAAVGGQHVRLSATARARLNPFDLPPPPGPAPGDAPPAGRGATPEAPARERRSPARTSWPSRCWPWWPWWRSGRHARDAPQRPGAGGRSTGPSTPPTPGRDHRRPGDPRPPRAPPARPLRRAPGAGPGGRHGRRAGRAPAPLRRRLPGRPLRRADQRGPRPPLRRLQHPAPRAGAAPPGDPPHHHLRLGARAAGPAPPPAGGRRGLERAAVPRRAGPSWPAWPAGRASTTWGW